MKTLLMVIVFCLSISAASSQESLLVKKAFDVKKLFGADFGDSKDSLVRLIDYPMPKKKEFAVVLTDCQTYMFGVGTYACTAIVSKGKVIGFFTYVFDEDVPKFLDSLSVDSFILSLPGEKKGFSVHYTNCTVIFMEDKGKYRASFVRGKR